MNATRHDGYPIQDLTALLIAAFVLHGAFGYQSPILAQGGLLDTDAYMRLVRVEELWQTGAWYQTVTAKLGAPDGLSLHWTRPLDLIILFPALLLNLLGLSFHHSVYWVGVVVSPVLHTLACIGAAWAAKPLFPQHGAWRLAALILLLNGAALGYSLAGRPDHHVLSLLCTVMAAGYLIRAAMTPARRRPALLAGIWAGAGIWVTPEAMLTLAPALIGFGLLWLGARDGRQWAQLGYRFGLGLMAIVALAVAVEQPPSAWLAAEYDKVSILHLAIAAGVVIDFRLAMTIPWQGWRRVGLAVIIAIGTAALLAALFPRFYLGPLGNISADAAAVFMDDVREMRALWPTDRENTVRFTRVIGNSLAAIPAIAYFLWIRRGESSWPPILLLSLSYALALIGALLHARLAVPLSALGAILGCGSFAMLCNLAGDRGYPTRLGTRLAGYFIVAFGIQFYSLVPQPAEATEKEERCDVASLAEWLNVEQPARGPGNDAPIVLTDSINYSPALAYRTPYRFVGGPYHRGIDDVADMFTAMISSEDDVSREIARRRTVDLVLICVKGAPRPVRESGPQSLYYRLQKNDVPDWLAPVPMSPEAESEFRLFAVTH